MLTTDYKDGSPNWVDLGTPDVDAAAGFYQGLFGWDFRPGGEEVGGTGCSTSTTRRSPAV